MPRRPYGWVPNALTILRVLIVSLTYAAVFTQNLSAFVVLVLLAVMSDMLDGPIARGIGVADRTGANFDSAADFMFYISLPVWAYFWRPEEIGAHFAVLGVYTALYLVALLALHYSQGILGLHNRWTRLAGTSGVFFALFTVMWGWDDLVFGAVIVLLTFDLLQRFWTIWRERKGRALGPVEQG